jgi:transposase-like protein
MTMKIPVEGEEVNRFWAELQAQLAQAVIERVEKQLEAEVEAWLHRGYHQRRCHVSRQSRAYCQRCGTRKARAFSRNGHRQRQMVTCYGVLTFWLPRVVCACGGSVAIPFSIVQPYQRWWDDVLEQIERWAQLGLSLRQMQGEIGKQMKTQVGLRKLNAVVGAVAVSPAIELTSVPPIILLDAIWVPLLADTRATQRDRLGRQRIVKVGQKVCVLIALGLYPQSGRWGILEWAVADEESQTAWEGLLLPLEQRGLYRQRGVELFIHDGGSGLRAALDWIYPHIPHQRCLFHKLRNLWHSIQTPPDLSPQQRRLWKSQLLQCILPIFEAADAQDAQQLCNALCQMWQATQPKLVATLQRDWQETIAFFRVLKRFPHWHRTALRTTSLLERVNRLLRRLFRPAGAFHSLLGLLATLARVLNPHRLI